MGARSWARHRLGVNMLWSKANEWDAEVYSNWESLQQDDEH